MVTASKNPTPRRGRKVATIGVKGTGRSGSTRAGKTGSKGTSDAIPNDLSQKLYREMLLIRRFEEKAGQLYGMGLIGGFCHLYIGQEAVVVGVQSEMKSGDTLITSYRDHGHMLACGMNPDGVMAELTGRSGGYSSGKGGSMHMFSVEKGFYGGHGIVGAQVPIGAGIAFAHSYLGEDLVNLAYMGDGALNQGQVYESFNMASLWKLPVVFVIENNRYGMGTSIERSSAKSTELYHRGQAYDIPGMQVDGMDVFAVKDAAAQAIAHARSGKGPFVLEMLTYRYRGHSMSDPAKYRSKEEVQKVREERDPVERLRGLILAQGLMDEDSLKAIDKEVKAVVSRATDFARSSPEPDPAELYKDVYSPV